MKKTSRICVIGLGLFGRELARKLAQECDVLAIDNTERLVNAIADDVQSAVCLDARDFNALSSVVNDEFDRAIVCMAEDLESSILSVLHLVKIGVRSVYAKSRNDDHADILRAIGASEVVFPERETALRLANRVLYPNLLDLVPLPKGHFILELDVPAKLVGYSLLEANLRKKYGVFVLAVQDPSGRMNFMPEPETKLEASDRLIAIGKEENLAALEKAEAPRKEGEK